jgi:hypothetical protein
MVDEAEQSAIDEITKLVTRYVEGFGGSPALTVEFYAEPMIYVGPDRVSVFTSKQDAIAFVEGMLARLRPRGFSYSTAERCFVRMLHPSIALCAVAGTRRRADGSELERIGATYLLTGSPTWKIGELIATDLERVRPWAVA